MTAPDLRPVPRLVECARCRRWLWPRIWGTPPDLAVIDGGRVICEGCAREGAC